jgi:hypothetical protein
MHKDEPWSRGGSGMRWCANIHAPTKRSWLRLCVSVTKFVPRDLAGLDSRSKIFGSFFLMILVVFELLLCSTKSWLTVEATRRTVRLANQELVSWSVLGRTKKPSPERLQRVRGQGGRVSTYFPDDDIIDDLVPSSEKRVLRKTEAPLPTFNKAATIAICEKKLKKMAQLIAIQIARRTRRDGTFQWKLDRIGDLVGCTKNTVTTTIDEIVAAGLMERRYTNTGCVYVWTRAAYRDADVGASPEIGCSHDSHLSSPFRSVVVATHLVVWRETYTPKEKKHSARIESDHSRISDARLAFLEPYAVELANRWRLVNESFDSARERGLLAFFKDWLARPGTDKCLVNARHPLHMLSERDIREHFAKLYTTQICAVRHQELPAASSETGADETLNRVAAREALDFAKKLPAGPTTAIPKRAA